MKPHIAIFDDAFFDCDDLLDLLIQRGFRDVISPYDGVLYPGICELPADSMQMCLEQVLGVPIDPLVCFARLTCAGLKPAPHAIHPDTLMSQYAVLVYLSKDWPAGSGTSFWEHETHGRVHDRTRDAEMLQKDSNDRAKWTQYFISEGKQNRMLLYDSRLFHCAEPSGGFGDSPENGRIVQTCFFNLK